MPGCGSQALSTWHPWRQSASEPLHIVRTASGRLDGHNSYRVVGPSQWISHYGKSSRYTAGPWSPPVPILGPERGVRYHPSMLQVVRTTPALSVADFVRYEATMAISKRTTIVE